ncbi:MAG: hypothetical protein RR123_01055 [Clostridia bacterium]
MFKFAKGTKSVLGNRKGAAMITVLMVMTILTTMSLGVLAYSTNIFKKSITEAQGSVAYYEAKAIVDVMVKQITEGKTTDNQENYLADKPVHKVVAALAEQRRNWIEAWKADPKNNGKELDDYLATIPYFYIEVPFQNNPRNMLKLSLTPDNVFIIIEATVTNDEGGTSSASAKVQHKASEGVTNEELQDNMTDILTTSQCYYIYNYSTDCGDSNCAYRGRTHHMHIDPPSGGGYYTEACIYFNKNSDNFGSSATLPLLVIEPRDDNWLHLTVKGDCRVRGANYTDGRGQQTGNIAGDLRVKGNCSAEYMKVWRTAIIEGNFNMFHAEVVNEVYNDYTAYSLNHTYILGNLTGNQVDLLGAVSYGQPSCSYLGNRVEVGGDAQSVTPGGAVHPLIDFGFYGDNGVTIIHGDCRMKSTTLGSYKTEKKSKFYVGGDWEMHNVSFSVPEMYCGNRLALLDGTQLSNHEGWYRDHTAIITDSLVTQDALVRTFVYILNERFEARTPEQRKYTFGNNLQYRSGSINEACYIGPRTQFWTDIAVGNEGGWVKKAMAIYMQNAGKIKFDNCAEIGHSSVAVNIYSDGDVEVTRDANDHKTARLWTIFCRNLYVKNWDICDSNDSVCYVVKESATFISTNSGHLLHGDDQNDEKSGYWAKIYCPRVNTSGYSFWNTSFQSGAIDEGTIRNQPQHKSGNMDGCAISNGDNGGMFDACKNKNWNIWINDDIQNPLGDSNWMHWEKKWVGALQKNFYFNPTNANIDTRNPWWTGTTAEYINTTSSRFINITHASLPSHLPIGKGNTIHPNEQPTDERNGDYLKSPPSINRVYGKIEKDRVVKVSTVKAGDYVDITNQQYIQYLIDTCQSLTKFTVPYLWVTPTKDQIANIDDVLSDFENTETLCTWQNQDGPDTGAGHWEGKDTRTWVINKNGTIGGGGKTYNLDFANNIAFDTRAHDLHIKIADNTTINIRQAYGLSMWYMRADYKGKVFIYLGENVTINIESGAVVGAERAQNPWDSGDNRYMMIFGTQRRDNRGAKNDSGRLAQNHIMFVGGNKDGGLTQNQNINININAATFQGYIYMPYNTNSHVLIANDNRDWEYTATICIVAENILRRGRVTLAKGHIPEDFFADVNFNDVHKIPPSVGADEGGFGGYDLIWDFIGYE